jgi:hypothetical protein
MTKKEGSSPTPDLDCPQEPKTTSTPHPPRQEAGLCHAPAWTCQASGTGAEHVEEEQKVPTSTPVESRPCQLLGWDSEASPR